ncbi:MAG: 4-hydroxy-tetrahydrodipicolinate reductase [Actinomycetes bacterium]
MSITVGVLGAGGRMGAEVCRAVVGDPGVELVAAVDPHHQDLDLRVVANVDSPLRVLADVDALIDVGPQVVVDFTTLEVARRNLPRIAAAGIHAVVGTSGLTEADLDELRSHFTTSSMLVASNFAIGAVLMMHFAELAAPFFDSVAVIELHHENKIDAPSGTAVETAERIAAASSEWIPDPTTKEVMPGAIGAKGPGGVPVHAIRLRGLVSHQEVIFGSGGQLLTIKHDSTNRESFMPGVLLAVKHVGDQPGVTVGLEHLLGI